MRPLSDDLRAAILKRTNEGASQAEIARELRVSPAAVSSHIRRHARASLPVCTPSMTFDALETAPRCPRCTLLEPHVCLQGTAVPRRAVGL